MAKQSKKRISLTELCRTHGVIIEDSDINDATFPPVAKDEVAKKIFYCVIMDTNTTSEMLQSIKGSRKVPGNIYDLVSHPSSEEDAQWVALGSTFRRKGKVYHPCFTVKGGKPRLELVDNVSWRDGYVFIAKS